MSEPVDRARAAGSGFLTPDALRWRCDPGQFDFETSDQLQELDGFLGQERAERAIEFGLGMRREGYNLYVLGPPGSGKRTVVHAYLEKHAREQPKPGDWCYVNNFDDEGRPTALFLPAGLGRRLVDDMAQLVDDLQLAIPAALESEEHRRKIEQLSQQFQNEYAQSLDALATEAHELGLEVIRTPSGVALAPVRGDKVIDPEEFARLPDEEKQSIEDAVQRLQPKLQTIVERLPKLRKIAREKTRELNREATQHAIAILIAPLKEKYGELSEVIAYLIAVETDVIENAESFSPPSEEPPVFMLQEPHRPSFDQYVVNLLVDNADTTGAPVIYEDHPYLHNLLGRVEHESHMGSLITHFSLIKVGALHRANGGYLVVQAHDVLMQPFSWEALKRALRTKRIKIDSLTAAMSLISTVSLQPEPIPLDIKVVLLGDRMLYYLLQQYDPEFDELFKVAADFDDETDLNPENCRLYAQLLATLAKRDQMRSLSRGAICCLLEQAVRDVGDREKLSTHMRTITDLLRESDYWAGQQGSDVIDCDHVRKAIDQQIYRSDRVQQRVLEEIRRGTLLVDTDGERIGQVNGLSVVSLGRFSFGRPSRITATARLGRGKVVDIEREVELGGAIHSKGVLILTSLLAARFAFDYPLSFQASVVFEQSYGLVDGDSASVAEWCALLSALAGIPIRQHWAITGSLNQLGQAQPIGGVNEKIEGFFNVCRARGLTGNHGVLIPTTNIKHLMLRPDIVEAVEAEQFHICTYADVDQAIEYLTGLPAGQRLSGGDYPPDTMNFLVDRRLREFADLHRRFTPGPEGASNERT